MAADINQLRARLEEQSPFVAGFMQYCSEQGMNEGQVKTAVENAKAFDLAVREEFEKVAIPIMAPLAIAGGALSLWDLYKHFSGGNQPAAKPTVQPAAQPAAPVQPKPPVLPSLHGEGPTDWKVAQEKQAIRALLAPVMSGLARFGAPIARGIGAAGSWGLSGLKNLVGMGAKAKLPAGAPLNGLRAEAGSMANEGLRMRGLGQVNPSMADKARQVMGPEASQYLGSAKGDLGKALEMHGKLNPAVPSTMDRIGNYGNMAMLGLMLPQMMPSFGGGGGEAMPQEPASAPPPAPHPMAPQPQLQPWHNPQQFEPQHMQGLGAMSEHMASDKKAAGMPDIKGLLARLGKQMQRPVAGVHDHIVSHMADDVPAMHIARGARSLHDVMGANPATTGGIGVGAGAGMGLMGLSSLLGGKEAAPPSPF